MDIARQMKQINLKLYKCGAFLLKKNYVGLSDGWKFSWDIYHLGEYQVSARNLATARWWLSQNWRQAERLKG